MFVMPGLVPGIHVFRYVGSKDVDGRDKPGHDESNFQAVIARSEATKQSILVQVETWIASLRSQ
jgi:hypothetical protein